MAMLNNQMVPLYKAAMEILVFQMEDKYDKWWRIPL